MIMTTPLNGCLVHVALPGSTEFVTAGRFELTTDPHDLPTGRFQYDERYLARADAMSIDPIALPLSTARHRTTLLGGVFGALRDGAPDFWGRRILARAAGDAQLTDFDYLLRSPDDRAGALAFGPTPQAAAPRRTFNPISDLPVLQAYADAIVGHEPLPGVPRAQEHDELMRAATGLGGARPKALVEDDDGLWIAKFIHPHDQWSQPRVEHAMLALARTCGLHTAESRVTLVDGRDVLLVKRFDRERTEGGYLRAGMLSALTLLQAGETVESRERWSYLLLVDALRRISSRPEADAHELFRRMCFNALISNTDDHPRNHAALAAGRNWRLSPAYDVTAWTPVSVERRDLALECGDLGRYANADNLLSQCARFLLEPAAARRIIDDMERTVKDRWREIARAAGVLERDCDTIAGAFAYPGFRLRPAGQ